MVTVTVMGSVADCPPDPKNVRLQLPFEIGVTITDPENGVTETMPAQFGVDVLVNELTEPLACVKVTI